MNLPSSIRLCLFAILLHQPMLASAAPGSATRTVLTAEAAREVVEAARLEAQRSGLAVSIAVVDEHGTLLMFERMDHAVPASAELALDKAISAARFGKDTKFFQDLANTGSQNAILGLPGLVPVEGGVPLHYGDATIGAVGVSGARSAQDGALAGAAAAALTP